MKIARCDYCRNPIPAGGKVVSLPGGLLFDSTKCEQQHLIDAQFKAVANAVRVARSRLKARTILRAETVYRKLGAGGWPKVKKLLEAVL